MTDEGVIRLVTKPELEAREEQEFIDGAHAEAIGMLEAAIRALRDRTYANGARCSGLAISFAFENGCYGRLVPEGEHSAGLLIGAVATTQQDLILRTLVPE